MFNNYYASNNHSLNINAVNGTLVKNHPKSIFVYALKDSSIFKTKPTHSFVDKTQWGDEVIRTKRCVVLQAMLIAPETFLCEIVSEEDFENSFITETTSKEESQNG